MHFNQIKIIKIDIDSIITAGCVPELLFSRMTASRIIYFGVIICFYLSNYGAS